MNRVVRQVVAWITAPDKNLGPVLVLLTVLIILFAVLTPETFLTPANASNVLRQASFNALMAIGVMVVMIAGGLDISIGSVLAMSAALVMGLQPLGVPLAVALALAFGLTVGLVNGLLVLRVGIVHFVATLGTMTIVGGMVHAYTGSRPIPGQSEAFTVLGAGSLGLVPVPFIILVVVAVATGYVLNKTAFGRSLYAIGGNPDAAALVGINTSRAVLVTYVFSGALAAVAGILLAAQINTSSTQLGLDTPLFVLSAVIIGGASIFGGRGSALGAVLGVVALTILSNGMNGLGILSAQQTMIKAGVFVAVVVFDAVSVALVVRRRQRAARGGGTAVAPTVREA